MKNINKKFFLKNKKIKLYIAAGLSAASLIISNGHNDKPINDEEIQTEEIQRVELNVTVKNYEYMQKYEVIVIVDENNKVWSVYSLKDRDENFTMLVPENTTYYVGTNDLGIHQFSVDNIDDGYEYFLEFDYKDKSFNFDKHNLKGEKKL